LEVHIAISTLVLTRYVFSLSSPAHFYLFLDVVIRAALVERMPVLDEATYSAKHEMGVDGHHTTAAVVSEANGNGHTKHANGKQATATSNLMDLLSFTDEQPSSPSISAGENLLDLLGAGPMGGGNSIISPGTRCYPVIA
jgi:AP-1 complex subunit gamma-1